VKSCGRPVSPKSSSRATPITKKATASTGLTGLQDYVIVDVSAKQFFQKVPKIPFVSDTVFLGVLGFNGLTAFFGMEIAAPKKGETLVVSAAAGATGSIAGQMERFTAAASLALRALRQMRVDHQGSQFRRRRQLQACRLERKLAAPLPTASTSILKMSAEKSCKKS